MKYIPLFLACFLAVEAASVYAQTQYPQTQYQGFSHGGDFATTPPNVQDDSSDDYRSMSPDSWENAGSLNGSDPSTSWDSEHVQPSSSDTPELPLLPPSSELDSGKRSPPKSNSPFSNASHASEQEAFPSDSEPAAPSIPSDIRGSRWSSRIEQPFPDPQGDFSELAKPGRYPISTPRNRSTDWHAQRSSVEKSGMGYRYERSSMPTFTPEDFPEGNNVTLSPSGTRESPQPRLISHPGSIIRSPNTTLPPPPKEPWKYPDSRMVPASSEAGSFPRFRTDLGHRDVMPTHRDSDHHDHGQKFDFEEKKKEYPPLKEILATGRYFASATTLYLKPAFQGNTVIAESNSGVSTPFDFDYEGAPQFQFGFESKFGPGFELNYWQYDESSNTALFTSDGVESGTTSVWMLGPNQWSRLTASNSGETITAEHSIDVESIGALFFKEVKLPISRINGKFGFQYVSIAHQMDAVLTDSGSAEIGSLSAQSDMRAVGPQMKFEYFRPVGHTKLELVTGFGGSVLFGKQDQFVSNSSTGQLSRVGADEFLTMIDFMGAIQYRKMIAEKRYWFVRTGYQFQTWLNGGTAVLPQDDFGLRGFTFTAGYNR